MNSNRQNLNDIEKVMQRSAEACMEYQKTSPANKAWFLDTIADNIEGLGEDLIKQASDETNLPAARLTGERGRTTMQLRMFAQMLREGSWVEASIDTAIPDKSPPNPSCKSLAMRPRSSS